MRKNFKIWSEYARIPNCDQIWCIYLSCSAQNGVQTDIIIETHFFLVEEFQNEFFDKILNIDCIAPITKFSLLKVKNVPNKCKKLKNNDQKEYSTSKSFTDNLPSDICNFMFRFSENE